MVLCSSLLCCSIVIPSHIISHIGSGAWVGLLLGGVTGSGAALMIPIERVFSDIETVTGLKVVMPSKAPL
jgi:hypothetical protein